MHTHLIASLLVLSVVSVGAQRAPARRVHDLIVAEGIPITGVSEPNPPQYPDWRITFDAGATAAQRTRAAAIAAAFDPNDLSKEPKLVAPDVMVERMTDAELSFLASSTDPVIKKFWLVLVSLPRPADVRSPRFVQGWAYIKRAGLSAVPPVWTSAADAAARLADITK